MSNRLKLPFALIIASLLLGGCMQVPEDLPPLSAATTGAAVTG
ncbi:hypothetical protein [Pseudomonas koreensis]|uniref:Uncharacterized protein n=1 Tax=Pseudomonas koreensis TaxID=198620 RepID=A0A9X2XK41_9PSED|nr:hypothetical protein [Pseudomonas koreensis]MCU7250181.1 hypothetical protein [Pseudomonas koreensis]